MRCTRVSSSRRRGVDLSSPNERSEGRRVTGRLDARGASCGSVHEAGRPRPARQMPPNTNHCRRTEWTSDQNTAPEPQSSRGTQFQTVRGVHEAQTAWYLSCTKIPKEALFVYKELQLQLWIKTLLPPSSAQHPCRRAHAPTPPTSPRWPSLSNHRVTRNGNRCTHQKWTATA